MFTNQQIRDHPACPFQGSRSVRSRTVDGLYAQTILLAEKNLRDFACDMRAHEPFAGTPKKRNDVTVTPYALGNSLHIGCSEKNCPSLEANGSFFFSVANGLVGNIARANRHQ